jgi:hypothetical protein
VFAYLDPQDEVVEEMKWYKAWFAEDNSEEDLVQNIVKNSYLDKHKIYNFIFSENSNSVKNHMARRKLIVCATSFGIMNGIQCMVQSLKWKIGANLLFVDQYRYPNISDRTCTQ